MIICTTLITKEKLICEINDKLKPKEKEAVLNYVKKRNGLPVWWDIKLFNYVRKYGDTQ